MKNWILPAAGVVLIAGGAWGLSREQFSYTKEEHEAAIGSLELSFKEKETIDIPKWLAAGSIAVGALLIVYGRKS